MERLFEAKFNFLRGVRFGNRGYMLETYCCKGGSLINGEAFNGGFRHAERGSLCISTHTFLSVGCVKWLSRRNADYFYIRFSTLVLFILWVRILIYNLGTPFHRDPHQMVDRNFK
jgi:hypothetical protein